jgi:uncharacterized protein YdeI (YjbR/CyaY-like superfamily)
VAPVIPDPKTIKAFKTGAALEKWIAANHGRATELWIRIYKKASGVPTITYGEALDIALCWGWIDGLKKSYDAQSFIQRFSPRRPRSVWSQVNQGHVSRLIAAGRMTPHGQKQIEAAKADGRWARAYAPIRSAGVDSIPKDLMAAIDASRRARKTFDTLNKMNLFALAYRTNQMKTPAGRARKIAEIVGMLARGAIIVPQVAGAGRPRKPR